MSRARLACLLVVALVVASCSTAASVPPSQTPDGAKALSIAALRYRLVDQFGPLWYCDRDFYPVPRADEADLAIQRFPDVQADRDAFAAIVAHLDLSIEAEFTAAQKLAIYRAWKQLEAITLDPIDDGRYGFDYLSLPPPGASEGRRTHGTIDAGGSIVVAQQARAGEPVCPICLARGTWIATPDGDVAIEAIRIGMPVWSIDPAGRWFIATVIQVGRTPVPASHEVVRLVLDDGRVVRASPRHPLADGRRLAGLGIGDRVDGALVISANLEPYEGGWTFDLLPDGPTGVYVADGVPLGSTLVGEAFGQERDGSTGNW